MFHPKGPTFFELARQALSSTERGYDLLAPKFDFTPFRTPDEILSVVAAQLERLAPFGSALDICCGTGAAMQAMRPTPAIIIFFIRKLPPSVIAAVVPIPPPTNASRDELARASFPRAATSAGGVASAMLALIMAVIAAVAVMMPRFFIKS